MRDRVVPAMLCGVFIVFFGSTAAETVRNPAPPAPPLQTLPALPFASPEDVIAADVAAQNAGNWDLFLRLRTEMPGAPEEIASYRTLWSFGDIGIRGNVISARLRTITSVPFELAPQFVSSCCFLDQLSDPAAYYVIIDYDVRAEDKYTWDGPNARLYILDRAAGGWKIVQVSEPILATLQSQGIANGTPAEEELLDRQLVRAQTGEFLNSHGDVIFSVNPAVAGDHQIPASITVANSTTYAQGCVFQNLIGCIDFNTYVKNVLPNEWPASYPTESLKAGAMAAKMYGWYHVYYAKYPNKGYDVYDEDCDQVYRANSAVTATNNAVNAVAGVGYDRSDGVLFETQYSAGSYNNSGYHGGRIYQNGSKWLADNGYSYFDAYKDIIRYYYDYSSITGSRALRFFTYSEGAGGCPSSLNVTVTSPVGGENWQTGTSHDVTWSVTGTTTSINYWKIALSTDGGATWPTTNEDPRQLSGGIFNPSARSWTWTIGSSWNTSQARIRVRALDVNGNILDDSISPANFTVAPPAETISTPSTPSGSASGSTGTSYSYSTSGSTSSAGHSIQYQFDWGDGQNSGWLSAGTTSASHAWTSAGTYNVRAQARCATHTSVVSSQSNSRSVTISATETVSTPSTPSGTANGSTGASYTYTAGGSTSSLGHSIQYSFDWGDGQSSGWLSSGTTSASHAWSSAGTYSVRVQARCATHTSVVSGNSNTLSVNITTTPGETISTPTTPTGVTSGTVGTNYSYSTGGSSSSLGHSVQYQFDWGDGLTSGWLAAGTASASHAWASAATYPVKAQARCATHANVVSSSSNALSVAISGGSGGGELIVDGGFEQATATGNTAPGWDVYPSAGSGHSLIIANGSVPHGGANYAFLGSTDSTEYDWLLQTVTIPSDATAASLTAWVSIATEESLQGDPYDFLWVGIYDTGGNALDFPLELSNLDATRSDNTLGHYFQAGPIDLLAYKGMSVQVAFIAYTDYSLPTTFLVDDISLLASTGSDAAPLTSITSPANGATVSGTVNVVATASDDQAVTSMQILIDGVVKASNTNSTSLSYSWNSTEVSNGQHTIVSKASDAAGHTTTSSTVTVTVSNALAAPANLVATATSTSQANLTWGAVTGAASYQIFRRSNNGAFSLIGTSLVASYTNSSLSAGTTYLYQVKAVDSSGNAGPPSNVDLATTIALTNDPVVARSTTIKAAHVTELRTAVNAVRAAAGLSPASFTGSVTAGARISRIHISELRTNLDAARAALGLSTLAYTDPSLVGGSTPIRAAHINELRAGVK